MSDPAAHVAVTRTNPADVAQRQIIVSIDGGPKKTLLFGESATFDVEPGEHKLRAHNTLVWKTVRFRDRGRPGRDLHGHEQGQPLDARVSRRARRRCTSRSSASRTREPAGHSRGLFQSSTRRPGTRVMWSRSAVTSVAS